MVASDSMSHWQSRMREVGMLNEVLGPSPGPGMRLVIDRILELHGGLHGLITQFEQQGLGAIVRSWVGTGPNRVISAVQLHQALGAGNVHDLAAAAGMSMPELVHKLTTYLPQSVDRLTPGGIIPRV